MRIACYGCVWPERVVHKQAPFQTYTKCSSELVYLVGYVIAIAKHASHVDSEVKKCGRVSPCRHHLGHRHIILTLPAGGYFLLFPKVNLAYPKRRCVLAV